MVGLQRLINMIPDHIAVSIQTAKYRWAKFKYSVRTFLYGFDYGFLNADVDENKRIWFYNNRKLPEGFSKSDLYNNDIYVRGTKYGTFYSNYKDEILVLILIVFSYSMIFSFWLF